MNREIYSIKGNPRHFYKAPGCGLTLAGRLRLSPTNKMSCGSQPANIRLINRRVKFPYSFHHYFFDSFKKRKKNSFSILTEWHIISEIQKQIEYFYESKDEEFYHEPH